MTTPGFNAEPPKPEADPAPEAPPPAPRRSYIGKGLITIGALVGVFALARSCTHEPPPPAPPAPPPSPPVRMLEAWEGANSIAVTFDTRGRIYGGVGPNYLQADRVATAACLRDKPQGEHCFGLAAYNVYEAGKMCIGIGVNRFDKPDPRSPRPARDLVSYTIVQAPTTAAALPLLEAACKDQPGRCRHAAAIYCNYR